MSKAKALKELFKVDLFLDCCILTVSIIISYVMELYNFILTKHNSSIIWDRYIWLIHLLHIGFYCSFLCDLPMLFFWVVRQIECVCQILTDCHKCVFIHNVSRLNYCQLRVLTIVHINCIMVYCNWHLDDL